MPQAMSTFSLSMTIVTPPNCPRRFITTNKVAKNQPHPQEISIYSLCSDHWTHIRMPSSKNVETKHRRAKCGRTCFDERVTYRKENEFLSQLRIMLIFIFKFEVLCLIIHINDLLRIVYSHTKHVVASRLRWQQMIASRTLEIFSIPYVSVK